MIVFPQVKMISLFEEMGEVNEKDVNEKGLEEATTETDLPPSRTIKICSREFDLKFHGKDRRGGFFDSHQGEDGCGRGLISIAAAYGIEDKMDVLIHEILEAIMATDGKRFYPRWSADDDNPLFVFDHNYLCGLSTKILDALLTSGFIMLQP